MAERDWIACSQEMPDSDMAVMTFSPRDCSPVWPAYHNGERWEGLDGMPLLMEVTHWMNFPEPPGAVHLLVSEDSVQSRIAADLS